LVTLLSKDELQQIPPYYRWLIKLFLKLPNPSLPYSVLKHFPEFEGIFWALIAPIFLVVYFFFNLWLFLYLSSNYGFPLNIFLSVLPPIAVFILFLRIQLDRAIHRWKSISKRHETRQVTESLKELAELLEKQQKEKS
jgi:hypothetical protein